MANFKYVVEVVVETDAKATKKDIKVFVERAIDPAVLRILGKDFWYGPVVTKARVRKVDLD